MTDHADFLAAAEEQRWTRPLAELGTFLREESWRTRGTWSYRILPGGACVAMRVIPDGEHAFHKELRISRREPLETFDQFKKWVKECRVFRQHLECETGWHTTTLAGQAQGESFKAGLPTEWVAMSDLPLQVPGRVSAADRQMVKCARCGDAVAHDPSYKQDICTRCAMALGTEETNARRAGRAEQATLDLQQPEPRGTDGS